MTISEERMKILNMIQAGKITTQEGMRLLEDLNRVETSKAELSESLKKIKEEIKESVKQSTQIRVAISHKDEDSRAALKAELRETISNVKADARKAAEEARKHKAEAIALHESVAQITGKSPRYFHLQVTDTRTGKSRVDVRMPVGVITAGVKMGAHFSPEIEGMDTNRLIEMINEGDMGKVLDVVDNDDCEHVEVYLE